MRALNGAQFSDADYIHFVIGRCSLGPDFIQALVRLLNPELAQIEGRFLVVAVGAPGRYQAYRSQGQSPPEAQYWANLTEISGLFANVGPELAQEIALLVKDQWQKALDKCLQDQSQETCVLKDEAEGEVFITVRTVNES
jgi:hypothetical protein